jgi:hypothetical protein
VVLAAVVMKGSIFWDITPRSPLKVNRCFGGTFRLHFQGPGIKKPAHTTFLLGYSSTPKMVKCSPETSVDF